ncbi:helix-turn-helix transcriptional regulator [Isoptericola sp. NPDC055881]
MGRHVLVVGDDGSGKSTVCAEIIRDEIAAGAHVVHLRGIRTDVPGTPYLPFLTHELARTGWAPGRWIHPEAVQVFSDELRGHRNVIVVDDLDRFDADSIAVLENMLQDTSARLVATSSISFTAVGLSEGLPAHGLLGQCAPAEVALTPLGYQGTAELLEARLGSGAAPELVSRVLTFSGGIPRVAGAVVDAARWAGALRQEGGAWTEAAALEDVPLDGVAHALTGRLSTADCEALGLLAWAGPVRPEEASALVPPHVLEGLRARHRIVWHEADGDGVVGVFPPALGIAVRRRLSPVQEQSIEQRVSAVVDDYRVLQDALVGETGAAQSANDGQTEDVPLSWSADVVCLVDANVRRQRAAARARWEGSPTVAHALDYLDLLSHDVDVDIAEEVLATTRVSRDEGEVLLTRYRVAQLQWKAWAGADESTVRAFVEDCAAELGDHAPLLALHLRFLEATRAGEAFTVTAEDQPLASGPSDLAASWYTLAAAVTKAESGLPEVALELIARRADGAHASVRPYLDSVRLTSLLLAGKVEESEDRARAGLATACRELDPVGIHVHALGLAQVLFVKGAHAEAWSLLDLSMRLGTAGPTQLTHGRALALASVLQSKLGHVELARSLNERLARRPDVYRSLLGDMKEWSTAHLLYAEGHIEAGDDLLWNAGQRHAAHGLRASAGLLWATRARLLSAEQLEVVGRLQTETAMPLFGWVFALHRSAQSDDERRIRAAARASVSWSLPSLTEEVLLKLDMVRAARGGDPLSMSQRDRLLGAQGDGAGGGVRRASGLSERELEIVLLARDGMSNREIADGLVLSVRTVENHLYRAMRKLKLKSRSDLASARISSGWR